MKKIQLIIPLAGDGTRFMDKYSVPKPLIKIGDESMISLAFRTLDIPYKKVFFIIRSSQDKEKVITKELNKICPDSKIIGVEKLTDGPCCTAFLAATHLEENEPLIIANCDQVMNWSGSRFVRYCENEDYDGVVVTYHESTPKNSYALLDEHGNVEKIYEKKQVSNVSLNGIHYWKKAKYFIESAKKMFENDDRTNGEFYIAPTYNYMINTGLKVGIFHIPNQQHHAIGTTEDLEIYLDNHRSENENDN